MMSWIEREASKVGSTRDRVILENPAVVAELDELLRTTFWPGVRGALVRTGYAWRSVEEERIPIESRWSEGDLGRSLLFMVFDELSLPILRGALTVSREGYLFEREFFLALPRSTEPALLFRILSDKRFVGNAPTLTIEESDRIPESRAYYWIHIESGEGHSSRDWTLRKAALGDVEETIATSIAMYERSIDGLTTEEEVEEFLALAARCFESC